MPIAPINLTTPAALLLAPELSFAVGAGPAAIELDAVVAKARVELSLTVLIGTEALAIAVGVLPSVAVPLDNVGTLFAMVVEAVGRLIDTPTEPQSCWVKA